MSRYLYNPSVCIAALQRMEQQCQLSVAVVTSRPHSVIPYAVEPLPLTAAQREALAADWEPSFARKLTPGREERV